jgi:hypothetical protein
VNYKAAALISSVTMLSACSDKLSMEQCEKDADCLQAYNMVVSANQTVGNVCPRDPNKTNPACESAMATLNTAEAAIFPRLKDADALSLSASLMATR